MLDLLCRIRYNRLFFVLILAVSTTFWWREIFKIDASKAVNGVITLDTASYVFSFLLLLAITIFLSFMIEMLFNFEVNNKIQSFFYRVKDNKVRRERDRLEKEAFELKERKLQKERDEKALELFISQCLKGGPKL